jgi:hypothetical protein
MIFDPARFLLGLLAETWGLLGAVAKCQVAGHDDVWVKRSMGERCECDRCGRPVAR